MPNHARTSSLVLSHSIRPSHLEVLTEGRPGRPCRSGDPLLLPLLFALLPAPPLVPPLVRLVRLVRLVLLVRLVGRGAPAQQSLSAPLAGGQSALAGGRRPARLVELVLVLSPLQARLQTPAGRTGGQEEVTGGGRGLWSSSSYCRRSRPASRLLQGGRAVRKR